MTINRRTVVKLGSATAVTAMLPGTGALAQAKDVKVALIAPLSGPWARQGELMKKGGDLAIKHINAAGGIKSLGGAKMQLVAIDAGDSAEKAKNAAQRMVSQEPDLIGGTGAWFGEGQNAIVATGAWETSGQDAQGKTVRVTIRTTEVLVKTPDGWKYRLDHASVGVPPPEPTPAP